MSGGAGGGEHLWIKMLESCEAVAESNRAAIERAASALDDSSDRLSSALVAIETARAAMASHTDRLEQLASLRVELDVLKGQVADLVTAQKSGQVGKGDLMWRVAVGVFGVVATALGTILIAVVMRGGGS